MTLLKGETAQTLRFTITQIITEVITKLNDRNHYNLFGLLSCIYLIFVVLLQLQLLLSSFYLYNLFILQFFFGGFSGTMLC